MKNEQQVIAALALDAVLGDPAWLPHPVRYVGAFAEWTENRARALVKDEHKAGALAAFSVVGASALTAYGITKVARAIHPLLGDAASILIMYTCFAARDLTDHSMRVHDALEQKDIDAARRSAAMMVGRDTQNLDESELVRAAVESVAENTVDGVTAPLFYAVIGGPVGAVMYKAANTLDSMFGYKNEMYEKFGFVPAKFDDAMNYVPARLTAVMVPVAADCTGMNMKGAAEMLVRDGRKHPSPNSGLSEAAMAGALNVQLGGVNYYAGKESLKSTLGEPVEKLEKKHIRKANKLMMATTIAAAALFIGGKIVVKKLWEKTND